MFKQSFLALAEGSFNKGSFSHVHVQEPAEEQIVMELLGKLIPGANRIKGNEELSFEQALWRNGGAAFSGIHLIKERAHLPENAIDQWLDDAQRVVFGSDIFYLKEGNKLLL